MKDQPVTETLKARLLKAAAFCNMQALAAKEPVRAEWERHAQTVWDAANALPSSSPGTEARARLIAEMRAEVRRWESAALSPDYSTAQAGVITALAGRLRGFADDLAALSDAPPSKKERCQCEPWEGCQVCSMSAPQVLKDAKEIVSAFGYLLMRMAVAKDAQDAYDISKREFEETQETMDRLHAALRHIPMLRPPSSQEAVTLPCGCVQRGAFTAPCADHQLIQSVHAPPSSPVAPERCVCGGEIVTHPYCVRCGHGRVTETRLERLEGEIATLKGERDDWRTAAKDERRAASERIAASEGERDEARKDETAVGDLLAYGDGERDAALKAKDRESYQFWSGWIAALDHVLLPLSTTQETPK